MSSNQIPGVPEGWELVRIGTVSQGEFFVGYDGQPEQYRQDVESSGWVTIIRKIEKPAAYRPFANAEEFKPHRDRWLTRKDKSDQTHLDGACRVVAYCDNHLWWADGRNSTYKDELNHGRCFDDDGTPFGVRIDE
jgi:hypothetical protein